MSFEIFLWNRRYLSKYPIVFVLNFISICITGGWVAFWKGVILFHSKLSSEECCFVLIYFCKFPWKSRDPSQSRSFLWWITFSFNIYTWMEILCAYIYFICLVFRKKWHVNSMFGLFYVSLKGERYFSIQSFLWRITFPFQYTHLDGNTWYTLRTLCTYTLCLISSENWQGTVNLAHSRWQGDGILGMRENQNV